MNNHVKKIFSIKGIFIFVALLLFTSSAGYLKSSYLDYIEVTTMNSSLSIGIATIKYSFILGLVLTGILVGLNKAVFFDSLADNFLGSILE